METPRHTAVWGCVAVAIVSWVLHRGDPGGFLRRRPQQDRTNQSQSYFPAGCRWSVVDDTRSNVRHVMDPSHRSYAWRERVYEFEFFGDGSGVPDADGAASSPAPACTVADHSVKGVAEGAVDGVADGVGATMERSGKDGAYRVIENLWFSRGSFYKVVDPAHPETGSPLALSSNINLYTIPVENVTSFVRNTMSSRYVRGETVLIDFSYFVHPTAIGHWLEYLLPLTSARRLEGLDVKPPGTVLVMHLKRVFVFEWVRAALGAAFGAGPDLAWRRQRALPFPVIFQAETSSVWSQIGQRLEGLGDDEWVCFERVLVARDVIDGGPRTSFMDEGGERDARRFRQNMWDMYDVVGRDSGEAREVEDRGDAPKRRITLLHKSANRRIRNRILLREMLAEFGEVDEVELGEDVPMARQVKIMAHTDILVSTHTSGLANAMFLPPGALVVELRHRNFLEDMERTFEMQIKSLQDVTWVSWKAMNIVYLHEDDERKFQAWGTSCDVDECVEAHTLVDIVVDVDAVMQLIRGSLK